MLGFFGQKKEKEESPEYLALVERWDNFLDKIEARFNESLTNAEEALLENLTESNYDLEPTEVAWQGIKAQLQGLIRKTDTTFEDKVKPEMLEYKERWEIIDQAQKGSELRNQLDNELERFEIVLEGKISTRFYEYAVKELNKDFHCTQCSAKLEVRNDVFRSHYVSCDYCNTVNTFYPNDKIIQIRWVVDKISKYKAIKEWDEMKMAQNKHRQIRMPSDNEDKTEYVKSFKTREETERKFWTKFFTERSIFLPEYAETIEFDVDNKMKWFYEERKRELNF